MSTEKDSISKTITIGPITIKLVNRSKSQNHFTLHIIHEDLPTYPFPIRHYTDELIELLIKEAIAQHKAQQETISSLDILRTIRSSFTLFGKSHAKQQMSLEKCRLAIREKMYELAGITKD